MMAVHRKLWAIVGILPLLILAACGTGIDATQSRQAHPTPSTVIQISIAGKPTTPLTKPTPTAKPPTLSPGSRNNGGSPTPTSQDQQLAQYVFGLINHDRAAMGLPLYSWSAALARGAHLHNLRMMAYGQLSHQCPGEPDLGTRITNDGIAWRSAGENIGWSDYPDPQQGVLTNHQSMMAEKPPNDGHRQNILSTSFRLVGIDVLVDAHHNVWLTEDFAQA
jgi:uncharacterized protein YkwD